MHYLCRDKKLKNSETYLWFSFAFCCFLDSILSPPAWVLLAGESWWWSAPVSELLESQTLPPNATRTAGPQAKAFPEQSRSPISGCLVPIASRALARRTFCSLLYPCNQRGSSALHLEWLLLGLASTASPARWWSAGVPSHSTSTSSESNSTTKHSDALHR